MSDETKISTYFSDTAEGDFAEVWFNKEHQYPLIKFYTAGHDVKEHAYMNKTVTQVECIAEDWALGYTGPFSK